MDKVVYWTDISEPSIGRASLHGGEPTTIIRQGEQANSVSLGAAFSNPHCSGQEVKDGEEAAWFARGGSSEVCHGFPESLN